VVGYEAEVNLLILGFNLVPAFPLDGGRVARALLWRRTGDIRRATDTAAGLGRAFGYLLIALGVLLTLDGAATGLWLAVIGVFLVFAAGAERVQEQVVATFTGVLARDLMSQPPVNIPAEVTPEEAQPYFERYRYTAFPLTDRDGRAIGLITIDRLQRARRSEWSTTTVGELADRDPALLIDERADVADLLEQPAFSRVGRAAVVDASGRPIGIVSLTDIERALRATSLRNPTSTSRLAPRTQEASLPAATTAR
jgi:CBS domain-containing protein